MTVPILDLDDHRDERGYVINPFAHLAGVRGLSHCHVFSIEPGAARGGHVHPDRDEQLVVLAGELRAVLAEPEEELVLSGAAPRILVIEPGRWHQLRNESASVAVGMCWSTTGG
jgi:mannose-6-phosphate isomerase-like protein (cupin superfamily)